MKNKRRLRLQILVLVMLFYIIGTAIGVVAMYYSSRNSYLQAKNDMIERDFKFVTDMMEFPEVMSWFFDYSKQHSSEIKAPHEKTDYNFFDNVYTKLRDKNIPIDQMIDSLSEEEKLMLAQSIYRNLMISFDSQTNIFKYGGMVCIDIREKDRGFVYYEAAKKEKDNNSVLGDRFELELKSHPAIKKILDGDYDTYAFEVAPAEWENDSNYYIGYMPLVYNGEVKAVMAIDYNWDSFHSQLIDQIRLMAGILLGGMVLCCIILMILVNRLAIKPLSAVQLTVREYMKSKDSDAAHKHLKKIKTHNEIGVLADDVGALTKEITSYTEKIKTITTEVMEALARTIDAKDKYTNGHSLRVAMYSMMLAKELGMSKQQQLDIYYMGLLHDIGKIGIPNSIINKTTKLTDEEYEIIKKHPIYGYDILSQIQSMPDLSIGARYHHERVDGKGYPDGLSGYDIPYMARIIAVADSYDTMTSNRSYRKYLPQAVARSEIENNIGTQFDLAPATAMLSIIDRDTHYMLHE